MKSAKSPTTPPVAASSAATPPAEPPKSADLGMAERRKMIRPLPVPEALESHGDTDWAAFEALLSDKP